jgi:hypothetical protein
VDDDLSHRSHLTPTTSNAFPYNAAMSESKQEKSWQARISESTDAIAQKFVESISYDRRIYKQDVAGSIARSIRWHLQ